MNKTLVYIKLITIFILLFLLHKYYNDYMDNEEFTTIVRRTSYGGGYRGGYYGGGYYGGGGSVGGLAAAIIIIGLFFIFIPLILISLSSNYGYGGFGYETTDIIHIPNGRSNVIYENRSFY